MGEVAKVANHSAESEVDVGLAVEDPQEEDHHADYARDVHQHDLAVQVLEVWQETIDEECDEEEEKAQTGKGRVDRQPALLFWLQFEKLLRTSQHNVVSLCQVLVVLVLEAIIPGERIVHVVQASVRGEVPEVDVRIERVDFAPGDDVLV